VEGIYIAYLSGAEGYSALLFVLHNERLTGADAGGGTYSGAYETTNDTLIGTIVVSLPPNGWNIAGGTAGPDGTTFTVPFQLQFQQVGQGYITVQTPAGPINAAIKRLQELP
jgi:hypothetical protein